MRSSQSLRISSKKLGVTALHVAAYFGQAGVYILWQLETYSAKVVAYAIMLHQEYLNRRGV
jgi:hypothetical protein